ncbi:MAG: hydrogenase formation protein HypD [Candidatus Omnitrophica bacterium]|nr:hydrogenase formation protein HypD [Candidatus Omnitrophota bacterium]MBL7210383.1 hydrogenase formation protein HypD [Candidatus Omnitrophota bacterium]
MKYIDEFRNKKLIREAAAKIAAIAPQGKINFMEVCGTHTQNFFRFGLNSILPANLRLIAGPGCPVCVSTQGYIDSAIALAADKKNIILTFGDMLRIPGSSSTLEKERARYGNVRVVYSSLDALTMAGSSAGKRFIFLAVGFETTAPAIALTIAAAGKMKLNNLFFLCSLKLIPAVMGYLLKDKGLNLQGFLCPGHVSAVIGTRPYESIARKYRVNCCVAGFEPLDILEGIYLLLRQITSKRRPLVSNQYSRVVTGGGNKKAQRIIKDVFVTCDADWRGFGSVPKSGLKIRREFARFDAQKAFSIADQRLPGISALSRRQNKCRCGDILRGIISPPECPLFAKSCRPEDPFGPCMVSSEGACNAYYKYKG